MLNVNPHPGTKAVASLVLCASLELVGTSLVLPVVSKASGDALLAAWALGGFQSPATASTLGGHNSLAEGLPVISILGRRCC